MEARPTDSGIVEAAPSSPTNPTNQISDLALAPSNGGFASSFLGNVALMGDAETGISVTGSGKASAAPDLAVLRLGVEAFAGSVAEARDQAAGSMDQVVILLLASGIAEKDIQTRHFNISHRYTSWEITR